MQATPSPSPPPEENVEDAQKESQNSQIPQTCPAPPANSRSIPFGVLTALFEKLQNEKKPDKRRRALFGWFTHWRQEVGKDLYPVLRLLLPQKDRERAVYGLKEKNLAKTYIKLIPLGMKDPDAVRLLNWKRPTEKDKSAGDFPTVLFEVISKRSSVIEGSMSIDEVNGILDDISKDLGKQDIQSKLLQRVYNKTTPEEQKWIARIILKDMIIGIKETTVFSVFHPDAHDLFNTCSDLKKVAYELWDTSRRLSEEDKSLQLFRAFAPMLCKRPGAKIQDTVKDMGGRGFIIEEKLDGERIQLHKRGNEYFYCSRKGKDYTYLYGSHVGTGSLTPYISKAFDERVEEIILDGEMLVWDPVSERNLPFGTLKGAALDKSKGQLNPRPCFKIFDLLYLNGVTLARKSLKFRKRNLRACVKEIRGRLEFITEYEGKSVDDVRKRLDEVMEERGEGLIIKHPNSEYVLNGRNKDWVKVKPEYMDNLGETVDLLVIGGNFGSGKRSGGVSVLICAVLDDRRKSDDDDEPKYSTFIRVGTGLTYADYVWIRQKNWKPLDKNNMPDWYQASPRASDDKGDLYIEPADSFILKVKAAEIRPSDLYHLGFTMRFPRAIQIRDDLTIADCMTATAVMESLKSEKKRKMEDGNSSKSVKKRKVAKPTVLPQYSGPSLKGVRAETDIFEDLKFTVASDPKAKDGEKKKSELLKLIRANGGTYSQVAGGSTPILVVYGGTSTPYDIKRIMDKDVNDIIRPQWIYDCIARGRRVPLRKKYFFHATDNRKLDREYNEKDGDEEDEDVVAENAQSPLSDSKTPEPSSSTKTPEVQETTDEQDSQIAEWFEVKEDPKTNRQKAFEQAESETDPDSDYDEIRFDAEDADDDWMQLKPKPDGDIEMRDASKVAQSEEDVTMGDDPDAMEYDQERIFKHLCFYLDTPENAKNHDMEVKSKYADQIATSFVEIEDLIIANGGKVMDLADPKLTHVVLDKRDISRRKELTRITAKPKRRNLVISDFIHACVEENTLLDEEGFAP